MPISSQVPIIGYVANGVTKSFAFPFAILSADDLKVKVGADVVTAGFSITGVGDRDGGSVTFADAPASLTPIILYREVTLDRTTDYQENGDLLAIVLDDDLDRIWMALQDQLLLADRALRSPIGETLQQLPPASERALMALAFDAAGNPIVVRGTNDGGAALALDLLDTAPGKGAALVGFQQAGAGAVATTVQSKLRESVSVRDFGAVGDGVTDDAPAIQAAIDYAETIGASVYLPAGIYGIGSTVYVCQTAAIRLFGDGIRVSVLKKLADVTGLIVPKTGVPNGIIEDFKIEGRGGSNPALNTTENTAGLICYVKMERANLFIQYCGGPAFTDPYPNTTGTTAGRRSYAAALLNDTSNTNNTKDFQIFAANCCGDALYVGVVSGTRDCNGMDVSVRSFQCTGFAINAQKGFRNRFKILSAQGQFHIGVCLAADTDNVFDIQYVESGDFTLGAQAEAARNEFNFYDSTGIATPYSFNNTNNIWRDIATRREHFGGTPVAQVSGTAPAFMGGVRIGGNATANRIDLYETGVWTATLYDASSGGNASATTVTGHYVQIGNLVVCSFINLNNIDTTGMTPGNTLHISLPKAAASDAAKITSGTVVLDSIAFPAGTTSPTCSPVQNTSRAVIQCSGTGVADALLTVGGLTSGTSDIVRFTLSYFV